MTTYQYAPVDLRTVANAVRVSTLRTLHHSAAQDYRVIDPVDGDRLVPLAGVTDTLPPHAIVEVVPVKVTVEKFDTHPALYDRLVLAFGYTECKQASSAVRAGDAYVSNTGTTVTPEADGTFTFTRVTPQIEA